MPCKKVRQIVTQIVNLRDIWRESLHGIWRIFHLPEEGTGAVRRSSRDDFYSQAA